MNQKKGPGRPNADEATVKSERFNVAFTKKQVEDFGGRDEVYKFIRKAVAAEAVRLKKLNA